MAFNVKGVLGKMKIFFFKDAKMQSKLVPIPYPVMYNPNSLDIKYETSYDCAEEIGNGKVLQKFLRRKPQNLSVKLLFDGTGTSPSHLGLLGASQQLQGALGKVASETDSIVDAQIKLFLALAYKMDSDIHKPPYLLLVWGTFIFRGVLTSADIKYTLFSSSGLPLRAEMTINISEHEDKQKLLADIGKQSPDLTKARVIKEGDKLDLLCKELYGDPSLYLEVARVNNLKNYRKLVTGSTLVFPPIDKLN
jgi:hypothetical protein